MLLDYDKASGRISFRHFSIVVQPCGVTKSVKTLIGKRKVPDMGAFQDVAEFLTKSGYGSVSVPNILFRLPFFLPQNNVWPMAVCATVVISIACSTLSPCSDSSWGWGDCNAICSHTPCNLLSSPQVFPALWEVRGWRMSGGLTAVCCRTDHPLLSTLVFCFMADWADGGPSWLGGTRLRRKTQCLQ